ncbi:hypothetical protein G6F68_014082 [Rhizopus microsporus]|nr:hypothetical protein G6F68_014082 [Rhizopus microsporus]
MTDSLASLAAVPAVAPVARSPGYWANVLRRLRRDPVALAAGAVILALIVMAILAPWISPADPFQASMLKRLRPIGTEGYPLGADELGRDMLSRLMLGARLSLFMGIVPVIAAFVHADHAGGGRVLRVSVRAAGDRLVRHAGGGHLQRHRVADRRLHPAGRARGRKRHRASSPQRLRRRGAGVGRLAVHDRAGAP